MSFQNLSEFLLTRVIDWKGAGEAPVVTRPAIAQSKSNLYGFKWIFIIPHSQLGPRFADLLLYPLALFAKKSS